MPRTRWIAGLVIVGASTIGAGITSAAPAAQATLAFAWLTAVIVAVAQQGLP